MKRIGEQALTFRFPAVVDGNVSYVDPEEFLGQWVVLSFVPALGKSDSVLWDRHSRHMALLGATLIVVSLEANPLHRERSPRTERMRFTVAGDPLGRLQRLYGGRATQSSGRGRTFLVDPKGVLRFHLVHSLSESGMRILVELLQACQSVEITALA